jgi:hypothetical protein
MRLARVRRRWALGIPSGPAVAPRAAEKSGALPGGARRRRGGGTSLGDASLSTRRLHRGFATSAHGTPSRCQAPRCYVSGTDRDANSTSGHDRGQVPARQCKRWWSARSSTAEAARRGGALDGPLSCAGPSCVHRAGLSSANTAVSRRRLPNLRYACKPSTLCGARPHALRGPADTAATALMPFVGLPKLPRPGARARHGR